MAKHKVQVLIPGVQTPEGVERFNKAVEARNQADFECFMVLRDLDNESLISEQALFRAFKALGESKAEARENAAYHAERVREVLRARRDADAEFSNAILGRE